MAYTTINKGSLYMNTVLNTGDNTSPKSITGVGFQPDWVWTKTRGNTNNHTLFDSVRGAGVAKELSSDTTAGEGGVDTTNYGYLSSFDSDGFTATTGAIGINYYNATGSNYVNWNWKAGGTASSNTDGTITSSVSANTTAGFSIATYTGNGAGSATVGHGLGVAPAFVIIKCLSVDAWQVFPTGATRLVLNSAVGDYGNNPITKGATTITLPSSVDNGWNANGVNYVMYTFAEKKGFSKFGSYTGNGNATDGPFIYTGFKPAFVLIKASNATEAWTITDDARDAYNPATKILFPNSTNGEGSNTGTDYLSNGFKIRTGDGAMNLNSSTTYIYMAFAENPFVGSDGTPVTAR